MTDSSGASEARPARAALVRLHAEVRASVTRTFVSVGGVSVVLTTIVNVAESPLVTVWVAGDFVIEMCGWITVTRAVSSAVTSGP